MDEYHSNGVTVTVYEWDGSRWAEIEAPTYFDGGPKTVHAAELREIAGMIDDAAEEMER